MTITKDQFLALEARQKIIDSMGRVWEVRANIESSSFSDVPGPREVTLTHGDQVEIFGWSDGFGNFIDKTWAVDISLNSRLANIAN